LEALVEAARSDSSGSVGGEMATWCLLHFVDVKEEHAVRAVQLGAVEALSQQLYSPEVGRAAAQGGCGLLGVQTSLSLLGGM
jgi:hypothetical protein